MSEWLACPNCGRKQFDGNECRACGYSLEKATEGSRHMDVHLFACDRCGFSFCLSVGAKAPCLPGKPEDTGEQGIFGEKLLRCHAVRKAT